MEFISDLLPSVLPSIDKMSSLQGLVCFLWGVAISFTGEEAWKENWNNLGFSVVKP